MIGHTKEELEARGARLENYKYCGNCGLYWAKRLYRKHLNVSPTAREITIIPPATERFLTFLAEAYIEQLVKDHTVTLPDGTTIRPHFVLPPEWEEELADQKKPTAFTVSEAVERFGLSREAIMAELEKNKQDFVVEIPAAANGRRAPRPRSRQRRRAEN